jgi:hypothetical protein
MVVKNEAAIKIIRKFLNIDTYIWRFFLESFGQLSLICLKKQIEILL